jgi:mRNA interferase RelE/StbE
VGKFRLVLSPGAVKDLDRFSDTVSTKIINGMKALEDNPFPRGKLVKKIRGTESAYYRLRVDKHRVFYMLEATTVVVLRILSKKDAAKFIHTLN